MNLPNGTKLQSGKYKIRETLGNGGFGFTYLAEHCFTGQKVAIKELFVNRRCTRLPHSARVVWPIGLNGFFYWMNTKSDFLHEVNTLWKLRQSHIVHVMDAFEENNTVYFVMEYLNGKTLRTILKEQGALPEEKAVKYIKQVAKGLVYLYRKHRYHLDIKPENIIIGHRGYAYIIDFGACIHVHSDDNTYDHNFQYTKHFAPKEVQERDNVTEASDVYSLGATLYNLLTNTKPADAIDRMNGKEHLKTLPNTISPKLRRIVEKSMRKSARNRYQTMKEFLEQLESYNR